VPTEPDDAHEVTAAGEPAAGDVPAVRGPDLARAALAQAKARAQERGLQPRTGRRTSRPGPRPAVGDARDPMLFGAAIARLVAERGWESTTSAARVMGEWDLLVGAEIAEHCRPASLLEGELVVVAESSAWATQLRLLAPALVRRLNGQVGDGVVTKVVVRGPAQPDWRRGPRRVQGRGPRDTYG
jgi:predicted nucleic acid-binding Zn ribbon protein